MFASGPFEAESFEFGEAETPWQGQSEGVFSETEQMELASEMLGITSEAELDRFLGDLIKRAGQAVGSFVRSPTGQALGGILKGAAKQALPTIGSAIGALIYGFGDNSKLVEVGRLMIACGLLVFLFLFSNGGHVVKVLGR